MVRLLLHTGGSIQDKKFTQPILCGKAHLWTDKRKDVSKPILCGMWSPAVWDWRLDSQACSQTDESFRPPGNLNKNTSRRKLIIDYFWKSAKIIFQTTIPQYLGPVPQKNTGRKSTEGYLLRWHFSLQTTSALLLILSATMRIQKQYQEKFCCWNSKPRPYLIVVIASCSNERV